MGAETWKLGWWHKDHKERAALRIYTSWTVGGLLRDCEIFANVCLKLCVVAASAASSMTTGPGPAV